MPVVNQDSINLVKQKARKLKRRLPDSVQMDDLVQCGSIGLMRAVARYNPEHGPFENYAQKWIAGHMLDYVKSMDFTDNVVVYGEGYCANVLESRSPTPEQLSDYEEVAAVIGKATRQLSENRRDLLRLHLDSGLSVAEIARQRGVSYQAIDQQKTAALGLISDALARQFTDSTQY